MIIYKTTNLINNKIYVGKRQISQSKFIESNYLGSGSYIKKAINKYGKQNFIREILEVCKDKEHLKEREKFWIKELNSRCHNGYNITEGGEDSDTLSHHPNKIEIGKKISKIHKNKKQSKNHINKKNIALKKYFKNNPGVHSGKNNPMYGKHHSKESIEKIINKNSGTLEKRLGSKKANKIKSNMKIGQIKRWQNLEERKKQSNRIYGKNNGMYGKCAYDIWIEKYGKEEADKRKLEQYKKSSKSRIKI